nr:hypothetical protein [uncultured Celeribacter sp.]
MHKSFHDSTSLIKYSRTETVDAIEDIQHPIIREVFSMYGIEGVDFASAADIPAGTGLASSSAFTCGMIKICDEFTGQFREQIEIADLACEVEIERLREPIGKQDQYGCAVPGLKKIEFNPDGTVDVSPILLKSAARARLEDSLTLLYVGGTRSASAQLETQKKTVASNEQLTANLKEMANQARVFTDEIADKPDDLGAYLHEGWERKKRLSPHVSNPHIDALYERALAAGATGGKLLGAGGAGFLLLHAPGARDAIEDAFQDMKLQRIRIDTSGTTVVHNDTGKV